MHYICDPRPTEALERVNELIRLVELLHVVSTADALALHQDVWYCTATGHLRECVLQLCAKRVLVEFYDVGGGCYGVFLEEDVFGAFGEGAVGFGEDDYWRVLACLISRLEIRAELGAYQGSSSRWH